MGLMVGCVCVGGFSFGRNSNVSPEVVPGFN
jgi:hypothetical protein